MRIAMVIYSSHPCPPSTTRIAMFTPAHPLPTPHGQILPSLGHAHIPVHPLPFPGTSLPSFPTRTSLPSHRKGEKPWPKSLPGKRVGGYGRRERGLLLRCKLMQPLPLRPPWRRPWRQLQCLPRSHAPTQVMQISEVTAVLTSYAYSTKKYTHKIVFFVRATPLTATAAMVARMPSPD